MNTISFKELFAFMVACIPFFYLGLNSGFSTEYIYQQDFNNTMTEDIQSWIGSSGIMFSFISSLVSGYLIDKFGRKTLLYYIYGIHIVGWMIIAKMKKILIGRLILSLANGAGYVSTVYLAEILQPQHRGAFLNLKPVLEIFGSLFVYLSGLYVSIETISFAISICALILFSCVFFMPETPYWYVLKKRKDRATESLIWLRNKDDLKIIYEINEIEKSLDEDVLTFKKTILKIKWWKTFLLFSIYMLLLEFTGFDMIIPYAVQFFGKFNRTAIDNRIIGIIFISSAFIGAIVTVCITEKFKRISLVKSGHILNIFVLVLSGFCEAYFHSVEFSIVSLTCICIYGSTISIVAYGLPTTIITENLPTEARATIFSSLSTEFYLIYFFVVKFFPIILANVPIYYVIWSIALFSLFNYIFIHNFLKETRGTVLPGNKDYT